MSPEAFSNPHSSTEVMSFTQWAPVVVMDVSVKKTTDGKTRLQLQLTSSVAKW